MGHPKYLQRIYHQVALETYGPLPVVCRCGEPVHAIDGMDGCVHHKDEDPWNNAPENLEIMHHACHTSHHKQDFQHTEETKTRISETMTGRTLSDEHRAHLGDARRGMKFSQEWRDNISKASRGRKLSEETKRKMSEAHRKSAQSLGRCECGLVAVRGGVARHAKSKNHTWERI